MNVNFVDWSLYHLKNFVTNFWSRDAITRPPPLFGLFVKDSQKDFIHHLSVSLAPELPSRHILFFLALLTTLSLGCATLFMVLYLPDFYGALPRTPPPTSLTV